MTAVVSGAGRAAGAGRWLGGGLGRREAVGVRFRRRDLPQARRHRAQMEWDRATGRTMLELYIGAPGVPGDAEAGGLIPRQPLGAGVE